MPIKQFFSNTGGIKILNNGETEDLTCATTKNDEIDWSDAEILTNSFKQFALDKGLGENLSFILQETEINLLLDQLQPNANKAVRIYLAYCNTDKTIRAFGVAAALNNNGEYDDFNVPQRMLGTATTLQTEVRIANTRPCPPQCGKTNVLNQRLP